MNGDSLEQKKTTNKGDYAERDVPQGKASGLAGFIKKRRVSFIIILVLIVVIIVLSLYRLFQVSRMGTEVSVPDGRSVELENSDRLLVPESDLDPDAQRNIF